MFPWIFPGRKYIFFLSQAVLISPCLYGDRDTAFLPKAFFKVLWNMGCKLESEHILNNSVWCHVKPLQKRRSDMWGEALQQFLLLFPSRLATVSRTPVQNSINDSAEGENASSHQLHIIYLIKMLLRSCAHQVSSVNICLRWLKNKYIFRHIRN